MGKKKICNREANNGWKEKWLLKKDNDEDQEMLFCIMLFIEIYYYPKIVHRFLMRFEIYKCYRAKA